MKKRISALVLSSCLLAGCAGQGAAATGETAAPSQAVPTAAPQSLTVNGLLDTSAAVGALELYAQAQNVTLQNSFETETADLVILDAPPQDDGTWKNLAENELLAAAAQRAGLDTESTVTALPVGQSLYAYWADNRVLTELLQSDAALDDLRAATWEEWFDFVTAVTHWCAEPGAVQVTLNGNVYTLPAERRETLANLNGVFAAQGPEVSGNSGDGGVAENTPALYTTALLAAGEPLTEENLTGPLNALEQELRLEDANSAWQAGIADLWTSKYLFQQGNALFYRGYLADLISDSGAALSSAQKDALVWLPIKNNLTEADIANQRFNLAGLMNYPILANRAWLAIPADADEESARAAAAAVLWLYTSKAGESALIDTLDLITPWGTGSNQNAAAAMQAAQVTAGILPGAALDKTQAAALQQAQRGLYYEAMQRLCAEVDIGFFQIITNDSGAGVCWSTGLYNGPNGPEACRKVSMADRIVGFLQVLYDAARSQGRETLIDITSDIFGYKAPEASMDAAWTSLKPGQLVTGRDMHGKKPVYHMLSDLIEHVRPMQTLPMTVDFVRKLHAAASSESEYIKAVIHRSEFNEYIRILDAYREMRPQDTAQLMNVLRHVAAQIVGEAQASKLLDAWCALDDAARIMSDLHFDNFIWMPLIAERVINRPLVPVPAALTEEETAYYAPFLFQATTEEQARDLLNIQGMDFVRGFTATRILRLSVLKMTPALERAAVLFESIETDDDAVRGKLAVTARRVRVLLCLSRTLSNAACYQDVLDHTRPDEQPAYSTEWPIEGDARISRLNELARAEIDNTYELLRLMDGEPGAFFPIVADDAHEDAFLLSAQLPRQLVQKAQIMLAHMRDVDKIYESKNK